MVVCEEERMMHPELEWRNLIWFPYSFMCWLTVDLF